MMNKGTKDKIRVFIKCGGINSMHKYEWHFRNLDLFPFDFFPFAGIFLSFSLSSNSSSAKSSAAASSAFFTEFDLSKACIFSVIPFAMSLGIGKLK